MSINPTKPFLIRSIYDWCVDNNFTPFISVKIYPGLDVPIEYIKNDEIIFNISARAVHDLIINDEIIYFMARFNGISRKLEIPMNVVKNIFAKEVNQGIAFTLDKRNENKKILNNQESNKALDSLTYQSKNANKPNLRVIK